MTKEYFIQNISNSDLVNMDSGSNLSSEYLQALPQMLPANISEECPQVASYLFLVFISHRFVRILSYFAGYRGPAPPAAPAQFSDGGLCSVDHLLPRHHR